MAAELQDDGRAALQLVDDLRREALARPGALECELDDLETWANLSLYFAEKLRGAIALETHRRTGSPEGKANAISSLERAAAYWQRVAAVTEKHYAEVPYVGGGTFSWAKYTDQVSRDIDVARQATHHQNP